MERFKNYGLWISIISLILLLMGNYGLFKLIGMEEPVFKNALDLVLSILITLGIVSNPQDGKGYLNGK